MPLFDVHAHLTHPRFADGLDALIERAKQRGISSIVSNGLNPEDNEAVRGLAKRFPLVRPAFGYYPVDAVLARMRQKGYDYPGDHPSSDPDEAVRWVRDHADEAFAIGEIGLDGYWVPEELFDAQEGVFRRLLQVALEADKAVIIHTRKRERRALEVLDELGVKRVNWHCFGSRVKLARSIAERGHFLSIPANARRSETFTRLLETIPRQQLLLETDCPYLSPEKERASEPADVRGTAEYAAELWGVSLEEVEQQLAANYESLFGAPP